MPFSARITIDNPFAVAIGLAKGKKPGKTSYVLCHQPKSFDWRIRNGAPHPLKRLDDHLFAECCGPAQPDYAVDTVTREMNEEMVA